jgi:hypothetical protein
LSYREVFRARIVWLAARGLRNDEIALRLNTRREVVVSLWRKRFSLGYQYLRARYYDPSTGRFITRDPLDALTRSAYGYINDNPLNGTDPTGLASYSYNFDLGPLGSPEELAAYTRAACSSVFPIAGCVDNFSVGQKMRLHETFLFYTQSFPVQVISETSTSFEFVALKGHPEGEGRTINFDFCTGGNGDTMLNVHTSSNGSILTNWWGIRDLDFFVAHGTWSKFAANIRANYDYMATDGYQPQVA